MRILKANSLESVHDLILKASLASRRDSIARRKTKDLRKPAAAWVTETRIGEATGKALSIVFATIGCSHARGELGGCTMCSYLLDGTEKPPTDEQITTQFNQAMTRLADASGPLAVKIYTSGSFLDPSEVSLDARSRIVQMISEDNRIAEVVIESRPEYVTNEVMDELRRSLGDRTIEIGIGLESSNDAIRQMCVNKGFDISDFKNAIEITRDHQIGVRAYVLLKPPFLSEQNALQDTIRTISDCTLMGVSTVSVNPVNVQKHTLVEELWSKGEYRPPWLWSLLEVLKKGRSILDSRINLICDPVAAGKARGVHNCGKCDKVIVDAIRSFSFSQDPTRLEGFQCECLSQWKHILEHGNTSLLVYSDRRVIESKRLKAEH